MDTLSSVQLFGVKITTDSKENILKYIYNSIEKEGKGVKIFTPNPEIIMYAQSHPEFMQVLNEADVALPDGIGVGLASFLCGKGFISRVTGVDFIDDLFTMLNVVGNSSMKTLKNPYSVGLFGGKPGVAEKAANCLQKKYSGIAISLSSDEWDEKKIKGKKIDILLVALGFPKQEKWISENINKNPIRVAMGVGGAFDFLAGEVSRAPVFVRRLGLEWFYRLCIQPWRIKRQLALISFMLLVIKESLSPHREKTS